MLAGVMLPWFLLTALSLMFVVIDIRSTPASPVLKRLLTLAGMKHIQLGHWGATLGQNFIYVQKCDGQYVSQV